jgi:hypothetical protein
MRTIFLGRSRIRILGKLETRMDAHPFDEPFRTTFANHKGTVLRQLYLRHHVMRNLAEDGNLFPGKHPIWILLGGLKQIFTAHCHGDLPGLNVGVRVAAARLILGDVEVLQAMASNAMRRRE